VTGKHVVVAQHVKARWRDERARSLLVGGSGFDPPALIQVPQQYEVLAPTEPERTADLVALVGELLGDPAKAQTGRSSAAATS
jgi:hypothetical protein